MQSQPSNPHVQTSPKTVTPSTPNNVPSTPNRRSDPVKAYNHSSRKHHWTSPGASPIPSNPQPVTHVPSAPPPVAPSVPADQNTDSEAGPSELGSNNNAAELLMEIEPNDLGGNDNLNSDPSEISEIPADFAEPTLPFDNSELPADLQPVDGDPDLEDLQSGQQQNYGISQQLAGTVQANSENKNLGQQQESAITVLGIMVCLGILGIICVVVAVVVHKRRRARRMSMRE